MEIKKVKPGENVVGLESTGVTVYEPLIRNMVEINELMPDELNRLKIIHPSTPNTRLLNNFRELRTKLIQRSSQENFVTLVSSAIEEGGASFVCLNLAASFALDQSKSSIAIDCNIQNPSLHKILPTEPEIGLTDFLEDESITLDQIIYASGVRRLRVIPIGRRHLTGTEYFTSKRMEVFIDEIKTRYPDRYVFIDAPSTGASTDARILVDFCDQALLVVPYGKVVDAQITAGIDALTETKLAGIVFNN